jgi:two-component system, OmpR family, sensor histidine kinase KdpD
MSPAADRPWRLPGPRWHAAQVSNGAGTKPRLSLRNVAAQVSRHIAGLAVIFSVVALCLHIRLVNQASIGFALVLVVLCASTVWGFSVAITMSVAATLAFDYFFLPPVGVFNISDPRDWVALSGFVVTAAIGSYLSASARREAKFADQRRLETERLCDFSQRLLAIADPAELVNSIPRCFVELFHSDAAELTLPNGQRAEYPGLARTGEASQSAALVGGLQPAEPSVRAVFLRRGKEHLGSLHIYGRAPSQTTLDAVGALIAEAMGRAVATERVVRMETAQQSEQLKSTLLDAIAHDFKTPLTTIKGSVTGLLGDIGFDLEQRRELLIVIDEECDRINKLIGSAADMAQLDAGKVRMEMASHRVGELISSALEDCRTILRERRIDLEVHDSECRFVADLPLAKKVLFHLVDNANLYSSAGEPITIKTSQDGEWVFFSVADRGPGIEEPELSRIFEKFYRGKGQRDRVDGTGMGLAIAAAIMRAHGGSIEVKSRPGEGSVFTFRLPSDVSASH